MSEDSKAGIYIQQGLKNSIYDGAFCQIMTALTSGIFLTGFALLLGANELVIGLLAAIPFAAQMAQLASSLVIEQKGKRKKACLAFASVNRLSWLLVFAILLIRNPEQNLASIWILVGASIVSYLFGSAGGVAWLSWMVDLVPEEIRGRYFAKRNMILAIVGVVVALLAGKYLDLWKSRVDVHEIYAFLSLFVLAVVCGVISLLFLKKIPDLERGKSTKKSLSFRKLVKIPLRDSNFMNFTFFSTLWSFSVFLASPFFTVYMLRDLKMSYALLALVQILSDISSILAFPLWGKLSDRFGSKPVLSLTTIANSFLPMLWFFTISRNFVLIIVILQIYGGIFWSGLNLNNNLLLKLSSKENNSVYLATFAALTGMASAIAPVLGGFLATQLGGTELSIGMAKIHSLHFIFLLSGVLRLFSRIYLQKVIESKEKPMGRMIKALGKLGTINVIRGFEPLLNHVNLITSRITGFVESKENLGNDDKKSNQTTEKRDE